MRCRFTAVVEIAERFARWHVEQCTGVPNRDLFDGEHWATFCYRQALNWNPIEMRAIKAHALGLCCYDVNSPLPTSLLGIWKPHAWMQMDAEGPTDFGQHDSHAA